MTKMHKPVKVFTHTDLDGAGVEIVAKAFFGEDMVDTTKCENHEVDSKVMDFLESGEYIYYSLVIVGDISFSKEIADTIYENENLTEKFLLVDHHKTALWLNNYSFARIFVEKDGLKASGTNLLLDVLSENGYTIESEYNLNALVNFVEKVRRYDTWDWKNIYSDNKANMLNQLFYMVGSNIFNQSMLEKLSKNNIHRFIEGEWMNLFSDNELMLLTVEDNRMNSYIDSRMKQVKLRDLTDSNFAYVYADQYHSQLGNAICNAYLIDYVMIIDINKGKVSLRSIGDYDVSILAKSYGGGGHKNASGFMFDVDHDSILKSILGKSNKNEKKTLYSKIVDFIDNLL